MKDIKESPQSAGGPSGATRALRVAFMLLAALPLPVTYLLGGIMGWLMYGLSGRYRRLLKGNLAQAGYTDAAIRRLAIAAAGRMFMELPTVWMRSREFAVSRVRRVLGAELIARARAGKKSIIFINPHLGSFEIVGQYLAAQLPLTCLYSPPKRAYAEPIMRAGRMKRGMNLARADYGGVRELVAVLKRGEALGILPDQVPGVGEGEWADFFGCPAYTMTLAAKLLQRTGVVGLMVYAERLPCGRGYDLHVSAMPEARADESGARYINRAVEELVRRCPGQYLWSYNRYKHPLGAPLPPQRAQEGEGASS